MGPDVVAHAYNSSYVESVNRRILIYAKTQAPIQKKINKAKRAGSEAQVVEHLPSKRQG
jgi:hypothetical protein